MPDRATKTKSGNFFPFLPNEKTDLTKTGKEAVRQRKIHMVLIMILIIILAAAVGGYYLIQQAKAVTPRDGEGSSAQSRTVSKENSDTVEYKGETYKYNDHLSNYLFMGIDTRDAVDTYQTQEDAGQADAIFLVSLDRAEETMKVLFIPRDTMTKIETFNPAGKSLGHTTDHINIQ